MARTFHHAPATLQNRPRHRRPNPRHSLGISLANRAAGPHRYRDENTAEGGKTAMRRRVRRTARQTWESDTTREITSD
jgi:hypothetical protein